MAVSFNSGGNLSTQRKQPTCRKSLKTLSHCCIEYTLQWAGFELTTLMVIGTDYIGSFKSNYHKKIFNGNVLVNNVYSIFINNDLIIELQFHTNIWSNKKIVEIFDKTGSYTISKLLLKESEVLHTKCTKLYLHYSQQIFILLVYM